MSNDQTTINQSDLTRPSDAAAASVFVDSGANPNEPELMNMIQKFSKIPGKVCDVYWGTTDIMALSIVKKSILIFEIISGKRHPFLTVSSRLVTSASFSQDGKLIISSDKDLNVNVLSVRDKMCINTMKGHSREIHDVKFSPDKIYAISVSSDCTMKLWDTEQGICIRTFTLNKNPFRYVCFSPDSKRILVGGDGSIILWETKTGKCISILCGPPEKINDMCFSPDSQLVLFSRRNMGNLRKQEANELKVWNPETRRVLSLKGHTDEVFSVGFSPDGRFAISGGLDKTMKIWEVASQKCIRTYEGFKGILIKVSFSPNGRQIVAISKNETHIYNPDYNFESPD